MTYTYIRTEPSLWTVGERDANGKWYPESDHGSPDEAAARVRYLNGGPEPTPVAVAEAVRQIDALDASDPEAAHAKADDLLLLSVAPEVAAAYRRLMVRADWWA
jgi:hypothetical protein